MHFSDFSPWGLLPLVLLLVFSVAMAWLFCGRMLRGLSPLRGLRLRWRQVMRHGWQLMLITLCSGLVAALAVGALLLLAIPEGPFVAFAVAMLLALLPTLPAGMEAYMRSLRHGNAHRRYLLANGATHFESLLPSVKRALRAALLPLLLHHRSPMPLALAMLFAGMLMGGTGTGMAIVATVLAWAAAFVCTVLALVIAIAAADRILFAPTEQLRRKPKAAAPSASSTQVHGEVDNGGDDGDTVRGDAGGTVRGGAGGAVRGDAGGDAQPVV